MGFVSFTIFIDGEAGTTGLQLRDRLSSRRELTLRSLPPDRRKDLAARSDAINSADVVVLCLPDDAAREAVSLVTHDAVKVIDASTAHRVADGWVYGFPELTPTQRDSIATATRVANPGCFGTGVVALVRPLVSSGLLPADYPVVTYGVSGYSGGGKPLIAEFEAVEAPPGTSDALRIYGLPLAHKHLPEMQKYSLLVHPPVFAPSAARFSQGMVIEVPLPLWSVPGQPTPADIWKVLDEWYHWTPFVEVVSPEEASALQVRRTTPGGYLAPLDPQSLNGTNRMRLIVFGSRDGQQARLVALLDNLGKGAAGAAVQNLNLMLGLDEATGL